MTRLDPEVLLEAYCRGVFPMTDHDGEVRWYTADPRGVIPLDDGFHVPRSLAQFMRAKSHPFELRVDHDFEGTMRACMLAREDGTWIGDELIDAYVRLHNLGFAHSVEIYNKESGKLAGGLYGVAVGGAFFGESMFHRERDASKVALVHLVERLRERGFELLDSQASTPHLRRFGCVEVPAREYLTRLRKAIEKECSFA